MFQRQVLESLAHVVDAGTPDVAPLFVSAYDPFLRPFIRASARNALKRAERSTKQPTAEHVARVAALMVAGKAKGLDLDAVEAIDSAYAALLASMPPRRRNLWPVLSIVGLAIVSAAAVFAWTRLRPSPEQQFYKSPFGQALVDPLSDLVISIGKSDADGVEANRRKILSPDVKSQVGPDVVDKLGAVFDRAVAAHATSGSDEALGTAIFEADDALAKAKIPAALDAYVSSYGDSRTVWLLSFYVRSRAKVDLVGASLGVARARRMDRLNLDTTFYVYRRDKSPWVIASLDLLEGRLGRNIVRSLAGSGLVFKDSTAQTAAVGTALAEPLRAAYMAEAHVDADEAKTIQELADSMQVAKDRLRAKKGYDIDQDGMLLSPAQYKSLSRYRDKEIDVGDLLRFDDRLLEHRDAIDRLVEVLGDVVEVEFVSGQLLQDAKKVPTPTDYAKDLGLGEWAADEVGGWLIAFADPRHAPAVVAEALVRDVLDGKSYSVAVTTGALGRELGLPDGNKDAMETMVDDVRAIVTKSPDEVRTAAKHAWTKLFGGEMPVYTRRPMD